MPNWHFKLGWATRMIAWTIYITFTGAVLLLLLPRAFARWIALLTTIAALALGLIALVRTPISDVAHFTTIVRVPWVPALGMNYHLAIDGVSLTMVLVTGISAVSTVLFSWDVDHRQNEFFFWLVLVVAGCYGVFLSADLFLFFAFYELVIVPKYFLIAVFGSTNKEYGAMKLTLYSFFGGMLVFIGILIAYATAIVGISRVISRFRCTRRNLAAAYMGADGACRCAYSRLDASSRDRYETRLVRTTSRGDQSLSTGLPDLEQMDSLSGGRWNCLRRGGGAPPARSEIPYRLFECQPHGLRLARSRRGDSAERFRGSIANVFTRRYRGPFICRRWTHDLSPHTYARPRCARRSESGTCFAICRVHFCHSSRRVDGHTRFQWIRGRDHNSYWRMENLSAGSLDHRRRHGARRRVHLARVKAIVLR